jgi:hypothetical protein
MKGHDLLKHYIKLKILFTIWTSWVSKDADFFTDSKNINLPQSQNAQIKLYNK